MLVTNVKTNVKAIRYKTKLFKLLNKGLQTHDWAFLGLGHPGLHEIKCNFAKESSKYILPFTMDI